MFRMAEEVAAATVEAPAVEVAAPPAEISVKDALKAVLLKARIHDGLKRGLHECVTSQLPPHPTTPAKKKRSPLHHHLLP